MRKNVTEYLDITEGLYSEKIAVEDANGCITFGEMKRNALKIAEFLSLIHIWINLCRHRLRRLPSTRKSSI